MTATYFSKQWEHCKELFAKTREPDEVAQLRQLVKNNMHKAKLLGTALVIISAAATFFFTVVAFGIGGTLGLFLGVMTIITGVVMGMVSYDLIHAGEKGAHLASKASHFAFLHGPSHPEVVAAHCQKLVSEILKGTLVLNYLYTYIVGHYFDVLKDLILHVA